MYKELDLFLDEDEEEQKEEGPKVDLNPLFDRLAKSKFRSSFYLNKKDKEYIHEKGWTKIEQGARELTEQREQSQARLSLPSRDGSRRQSNYSQAACPCLHSQRRETDSYASWHISAIHSPTCHRLLLPQLPAEVARHTKRQATHTV